IEIDVKSAQELGLNILAEGRLVNLARAEGHPSEVMDMSFANQLLGLEYLVKKDCSDYPLINGVHDIPLEIDQKVATLKAKALGVKFDEETAKQKKYRGV
ncbi:MAG TPA: adenosylhomocysteinase, partial [Nitrosopumilaceae archaeon]|nr:adenosylhomocysteinase [Nitrosopumilaceae archaeon]